MLPIVAQAFGKPAKEAGGQRASRRTKAARRVDIAIAGKPFTSYIWPERVKKPVLDPIRSAKGTPVTRGWPLNPRPGERVDHPHHVGLWFNYESVNGIDFWNNSDALKPEDAPKMGTILHRRIVSATSGADRGELVTESDWVLPGGKTLMHERTQFIFSGDATTRTIERVATLTALDERVVFADAKDGMLGMRVARQLEQPSNEPLVFTDIAGRATNVPAMDNTGVTGQYTSSEGKTGDAVWATRGRWTMLTGVIGDEAVTVAIVDHPSNPGVSHLLARPRLRPVRGEPARPEDLQRRARDDELHAAAARRRDVPVSRRRDRGEGIGRPSQSGVQRLRCDAMIHVGLIGAGNISDTHAAAAAAIDGVRSSRCAGARARRRSASRRACGATAYDDLDRFLDHRPMDLVVIGSPSGLHAEQGIAAAQRGLHVLTEKPIDVTTARADRLIAEADRAGVTLGVIFQDRMKPDVRRLKTLLDAGRLGTPILASASVRWHRPPEYYEASAWRGTEALDGGGALMNQGVHTVDLLLWLFGPVRRVFGKTATRLHAIEVEDTAVAVLEFASGALGTLEAATSAYPGYARRLELTGSEGTVRLDGDRLAAIDLRRRSKARSRRM